MSRTIAVIFRFFFAALALAALLVQLFVVQVANGWSVVSFFSYFTILGNLFASIVFIVSAVRLARGQVATGFDTAVRGASVVYMVFVGIVFSTLLRDTDLGSLIPWVNLVHHYLMPVIVVVDWVVWPPQRKLPWKVIGWWMVFPAVYVAYSLIRGAAIGFYPYPFFNPAVSGGYGGVTVLCLIMLVAFVAIAVGVRALGNWRARPLAH